MCYLLQVDAVSRFKVRGRCLPCGTIASASDPLSWSLIGRASLSGVLLSDSNPLMRQVITISLLTVASCATMIQHAGGLELEYGLHLHV